MSSKENKLIIEDILNVDDISDIYQQNKYFPFHLLMEDEADLQFVLGVRGDGKTHNAKKRIMMDWFENKIKSYWIVPFKNEMEEMMQTRDFHLDLIIDELMEEEPDMDLINAKYSEEDIKCHYYALKVSMEREFLQDENNEWFMRMIPLSMYHKYKKGAHPRVMRIYFDEFMRESYLKNEAFKVMDLITSVQREKKNFKVIFMGNAISLNHPMFVALDVYQLEEDKIITVIHDSKGKLGKIWRWKRPEEDAEAKNGDLLWYRMGDVTGYNDYAVKNEFKNDRLDNMFINPTEEQMSYFEKLHTIVCQDLLLDVYTISAENNGTGKRLYYYKVNKNKEDKKTIKYALEQKDVADGIKYDPNMSLVMAARLQDNRMWYDSIACKQAVWETLKRFF